MLVRGGGKMAPCRLGRVSPGRVREGDAKLVRLGRVLKS